MFLAKNSILLFALLDPRRASGDGEGAEGGRRRERRAGGFVRGRGAGVMRLHGSIEFLAQ